MEPKKITKIELAIERTKSTINSLILNRTDLDARIYALKDQLDMLEEIKDNNYID